MVATAPPRRAATRGPAPPTRAQQREAARFRRALLLVIGSIPLPGLAQFIAGNRMLGRMVLQVWVGLVTAVALVVWLVPLDTLAGLAVRPWLLTAFKIVAFGLAAVWVVLIVDAWRLGNPPRLSRQHRLVMLGTTLAVAGLVVTPFWVATRYAAAAHDTVVEMFPSGQVAAASDGRLNILLLGSDAGPGRTGVRPDSLNLVSVDVRTGATTVIGIPRNLERARFPSGTPAAERFPRGFTGDDDRLEWMINATWAYGEANPDLFPGTDEPGPEAVMQAVEGTLDLPVHYYVAVDMQGFEDLVDAVDGITVRVEEDVPIGEQGRMIEAGLHTLDGGEALWYARSRTGSSDYERMGRQRCVLGAMKNELNPGTVLRKFTGLVDASAGMVTTDIPQQELPQLVDLAWKAKELPVTSVQLIPPVIVPGDPDFEIISEEVDEAFAAAEKAAKEAEAEAAEEAPDDGRSGRAKASGPVDDSAEDTDDTGDAGEPSVVALDEVCSYE